MSATVRRVIWLGAIAAVVAGGLVYWRVRQANQKPAPLFATAKVERGRIVAKVTATGTLSALVTVQVGSQVSGRIQDIYVDFNSPVKKGQVLARIDPQLFQAAREQARANYVAAQGNLQKAQAQAVDAQSQYERNRKLAATKLIAQADLDTSKANADAAKAGVAAARGAVEQAKAALNQAQVNLGYTTIVSPTDGVVISRNVDVGQTVAASFQSPVLFVIAQDLSKMQVDTSVAEADVGKLTAGMVATFNVDAYPGEVFEGTVRQIRNAAQTVQNVVTYDAVIDVANEDLKLRPGMTANATFVYADKQDVLRVPNSALRFTPSPALIAKARSESQRRAGRRPGGAPAQATSSSPAPLEPGQRAVWVLRDNVPVLEHIEVGVSDGSYTEVTSGSLKPGDVVVTDVAPGVEPSGQQSRGFRLF